MVEFLEATSAAFLTEGLSPESFCFLVHKLIPAVAGSQSFARPGRKRVRVDSTWAVPDGLLYFPHDTFVFDVEAGTVKGRTIRCKTAYLDVTTNGSWRQTRTGTQWDWQQSISNEDLAIIAGQATVLADRLGSPIQVLHFIGVPAATGFPRCLPWLYNTVDFDFGHIHHAARLSSATHVIHGPEDLQQLAIHFDRGSAAPAPLRLLPDAQYLRSVTFLEEVTRFARRWDLPVDLQGSTLSAPYCVLKESGIAVRSLHPPSREDPDVKAFGKLVRDRIPDIVERKGDRAIGQKIPAHNWLGLLKTKIVEEAFEVQGAGKRDDILEEAADVLEVLRAISEALGESLEHLQVRADHKRSTRGGFDSGYVLKGTYTPPLNEPAADGHLFPVDGSGIPERRFDLIWRPQIESANLSGVKTLRLHLSTRRSPSPVEVLQPLKVIGLEGQLRIRQALGEVTIEIGPEPGRDLILGQLHLLE
jgi:predicted house-cleaning noncanonical NTP pyrophosphatase (MazG superfamily)